MKKALFSLVFLFFALKPVLTQSVTIIDSEDLRPVSDVAILNENNTKFIYSGESGQADISVFMDEDVVYFQHFTYDRICLTPEEIKKSGFEVKLVRKVFPINEFVISANRWEQVKDEVPNKITTVLKPTAEFHNPQTAADLISLSGEVFVQKSQLGGGSPMIRGFATNRVLIVIDGVRMNNAIYREGNIQNVISLDPSAVESTEIIFGPGAVVYGSDAIGGIMDFHTKKALLSTGKKKYFRSDAMVRYSSADREKSFHFDFNAGSGKLAFLTSFSWSGFEDLEMGSRKHPEYLRNEYVKRIGKQDVICINPDPEIQKGSGYSQLNLMNKFRFKPSRGIDIVLANHYSHISDVPRYDRLIQYKSGKLRYGDWYYGPQVWIMNNIQVNVTSGNIVFDEMRITAAHQNYEESRHDRSLNKSSLNEQTEKLSILSLNLDFERNLAGKRNLIYYGIEFNNNDIRSVARTRDILTGAVQPAGSRYPNGKNRYNSVSLYAGYKSNLTGRLTLNTGLRYNYVSLKSTIADNSYYSFPFTEINISNGAVTGEAGTVLRVNERFNINLNVSTGFRAPNLDDAGKVFDSAPGVVVVPNPGLKPEYALNIDLGAAKDFGKILRTEFSAYYTFLANAMIRHDFLFNGKDSIIYQGEPSKVEAITNAGSARVYGLHICAQINIMRNLKLTSSLNITEGYEKGGVPLRHSAPFFGSTHLIYETSRFKADFYSVYNGAKKFSKMAPSEIEKAYLYASDEDGNPWSPGWSTLNFKLSHKIQNRIYIAAGIENIIGLRYRSYSSGIAAPGRNFIISLRAKV